MREELIALAAKVEGLSGPDRELDWQIVTATGKADFFRQYAKEPLKYRGLVPSYTASLDAAMALVPTKPFPELRIGRWWWMVEAWPEECLAHIAYENGNSGVPEYSGKAATAALALTAAALKARAEVTS